MKVVVMHKIECITDAKINHLFEKNGHLPKKMRPLLPTFISYS